METPSISFSPSCQRLEVIIWNKSSVSVKLCVCVCRFKLPRGRWSTQDPWTASNSCTESLESGESTKAPLWPSWEVLLYLNIHYLLFLVEQILTLHVMSSQTFCLHLVLLTKPLEAWQTCSCDLSQDVFKAILSPPLLMSLCLLPHCCSVWFMTSTTIRKTPTTWHRMSEIDVFALPARTKLL